MISITQAVNTLFDEGGILPVNSSYELLNASAIARTILPEVEQRTKKSVQLSTLVVCVSRALHDLALRPALPDVRLDNFSIQSGLVERTYPKTPEALIMLEAISKQSLGSRATYFTFTRGIGELSIITHEDLVRQFQKEFSMQQPTFELDGLGSLSVQFNDTYIKTPNIFFTILSPLAEKQINIIEMVSTATELTLILQEDDLSKVLNLLRMRFTGKPIKKRSNSL